MHLSELLQENKENNEYKWEENGAINVMIDRDISLDYVQEVEAFFDEIDPNHDVIKFTRARGDDTANVVSIRKDAIPALSKKAEEVANMTTFSISPDIVNDILTDWPGPNEYT